MQKTQTIFPCDRVRTIDAKEVLAVLEGLDTSKSVYGVNAQLLKWCASEIAPSVCSLFKYMVAESAFPEKWKIGRVTAVHKRDEVTKPANYRPVQSLERLEMCFEEVTQPQLRAWIDNFIPKSQFGFVKGSGTEDYGAMLAFKMHCILEARKQGVLLSFGCMGRWWR